MDTTTCRTAYPSDNCDEEWDFAAPYLIVVKTDATRHDYDLREVLNGLRCMIRTGSPWHSMPYDLPPWHKE